MNSAYHQRHNSQFVTLIIILLIQNNFTIVVVRGPIGIGVAVPRRLAAPAAAAVARVRVPCNIDIISRVANNANVIMSMSMSQCNMHCQKNQSLPLVLVPAPEAARPPPFGIFSCKFCDVFRWPSTNRALIFWPGIKWFDLDLLEVWQQSWWNLCVKETVGRLPMGGLFIASAQAGSGWWARLGWSGDTTDSEMDSSCLLIGCRCLLGGGGGGGGGSSATVGLCFL